MNDEDECPKRVIWRKNKKNCFYMVQTIKIDESRGIVKDA